MDMDGHRFCGCGSGIAVAAGVDRGGRMAALLRAEVSALGYNGAAKNCANAKVDKSNSTRAPR